VDYERKCLLSVNQKPNEEIATEIMELAILGSQLGLTVNDLASLLRSGLSLEDMVVHMANQLTGRVQ
jgi:uncharacterized protein (DUF1800 family)